MNDLERKHLEANFEIVFSRLSKMEFTSLREVLLESYMQGVGAEQMRSRMANKP